MAPFLVIIFLQKFVLIFVEISANESVFIGQNYYHFNLYCIVPI